MKGVLGSFYKARLRSCAAKFLNDMQPDLILGVVAAQWSCTPLRFVFHSKHRGHAAEKVHAMMLNLRNIYLHFNCVA
jgi:hypothetical protein